MKLLKILLIIAVVLVAAYFIAALIIPKDYAVERTVEIDATHEVVFSQTSDMVAMHDWSPWAKKDTAMEIRYVGNPGEVGQTYFWKGNEEVGEGSQEIMSISKELIETKLVFLSPMEGEGMANVKLEDGENGGIKVTWGYYGTADFPSNVFNLMMDAVLGPDFELGMANLKELCENMPEEAQADDSYVIKELEMEARTFMIHRETVAMADMQSFFANHFTASFAFMKEKGLEPLSRPSALYFTWDEENGIADMGAGVALIVDAAELPEGYELVPVSGKALMIEYRGPYEGIGEAHMAMDAYMTENGLEQNEIVIEEYVTDPATEADPNNWITHLYYLVK